MLHLLSASIDSDLSRLCS